MGWSSLVVTGSAALMLALVIGCSGDGLVGSSGAITYDGESLAEGAISFHPLDDQVAPEGGLIRNGGFQIRSRPGRYRVEIYASRPKVGAAELTPGMTPTEQFIPAWYNSDSSLEVEVLKQGPNHFSFELEAEPAPASPSAVGR